MRLLSLLLVAVLSTGISCKQSIETTIAKTSHSVARFEAAGAICTAFAVSENYFITAVHCLPDKPYQPIYLRFEDGSAQAVGIKTVDIKNDVAILDTIKPTKIPALKMWDGNDPLVSGQHLLAVGFPAYLETKFSFEIGYLINLHYDTQFKRDFITSKNLAASGESGGPVVDINTGRVVGMTDKGAEYMSMMDKDGLHSHNSYALIVPFYIIQNLIDSVIPPSKPLPFLELRKF